MLYWFEGLPSLEQGQSVAGMAYWINGLPSVTQTVTVSAGLLRVLLHYGFDAGGTLGWLEL